ncbi:MAG: hypothetical protein HY787_20295 [Deltaproteobacteria bacterium]|nr:hypothetical protein [Deltaproteobacteria bacterium]
MERVNKIQEVAQGLGVFDVKTLAEIFSSFGWWAKGQSSKVNTKKYLDALTEQGKLERGDGFYRVKGSRSDYKEHARKVSECLAELWKLPGIRPLIKKESPFSNGLRPDAVILLIQQDKGLCILLEVANTETDEYLQAKINELKRNQELIKTELTQLLGYKVPDFILAVKGKEIKGVMPFKTLIQTLKEEK